MRTLNKLTSLFLATLFAGQAMLAGAASDVLTGDVHITVNPANILETALFPGAEQKVTMSFRDVQVADALRALGKKGGFNVLVDESVTRAISVDLNNVTVQSALESLKTYGNLAYSVQGKNLMVADADSNKGKTYNRSVSSMIPLKYGNAELIAKYLNDTVFGTQKVLADSHTNKLIVVGSSNDVKTVRAHVSALDQPRESKTWRLSQANAIEVARMLASSLFNEGTDAFASNYNDLKSGHVDLTSEQHEAGSDPTPTVSNAKAGESTPYSVTLQAREKKSGYGMDINPAGAIILPDTRLNAITIMGTAEQLAMADALIPVLDRKVPQVVLEASLIELSEEAVKELSVNTGSNNGYLSAGTNNTGTIFSQAIGRTTEAAESIYRFTTNPTTVVRDMALQINTLVVQNKAKILANPTIVTSSDSEAVISIVDEIIDRVTQTRTLGSPPTVTIIKGQVGIILHMLPRVGANGTVSLQVQPQVSTVAGERVALGNQVTLLSKRELMAQNVVLKDGETFMLGGLIHNTDRKTVTSRPLLAKLPILGALARNTAGQKERTELLIMITPHIINDDAAVARTHTNVPGSQIVPATSHKPASGNGNFVPVSMTTRETPSSLPPLEDAHVLGGPGSNHPAPGAIIAPRLNRPTGLLQDDMVPAPSRGKAAMRETSEAIEVPAVRITPAKTEKALDTSDDALRMIMDKFK